MAPRSGFYAVESCRIRFGRDGRWYADDQPITNQAIAQLFSRHLGRDAGGGYVIQMGDERATIEVEDTPFVVTSASMDGGSWRVWLNDGSSEPLDVDSLRVGEGDVLYCWVKGRTEEARFLRPAYYQLAPFITERTPGEFVLNCGDETHPIGARETSAAPRVGGTLA